MVGAQFFAQATDPIGGATSTFLGQGILGAIIVVLAVVLVIIYRSREKERTDHNIEIKTLQKEKEALMEARRLDAVEARTETNSVLPGISQSLQYISGKIETVQQPRRKR
jgi:hypothetical protein